jgi:hypothetical protein
VPVSPSIRKIAPETDPPVCCATNRQAEARCQLVTLPAAAGRKHPLLTVPEPSTVPLNVYLKWDRNMIHVYRGIPRCRRCDAGKQQSSPYTHMSIGLAYNARRFTFHQCITCPPSTFKACPVTCAARAETRNATISATSSGVCQRPSGTKAFTFSPAHASYVLRSSTG